MTNEELGKIQDEIARHLEAFHLPSMHVTALSGLLLADVVEPALRAEREHGARVCDDEATNLEAEQERIKTIDPAHSKYCRDLAYHARRYAAAIRAPQHPAARGGE